MNYWIARNKEKIGPLKREDLSSAGIERTTLVWREGLPTWTQAGDLDELAWLFNDQPAPEPEPKAPTPPRPYRTYYRPLDQHPTEQIPPQPPTYVGWSIAAIILCCMIPAIVALVMGLKVGSRYNSGDFDGAKRASDSAELWLIISIVAGLVMLPFSILLQLMS